MLTTSRLRPLLRRRCTVITFILLVLGIRSAKSVFLFLFSMLLALPLVCAFRRVHPNHHQPCASSSFIATHDTHNVTVTFYSILSRLYFCSFSIDKHLPAGIAQHPNSFIASSNPQDLDNNTTNQGGNPLSVSLPYSAVYPLHGSASSSSQGYTRNASSSYGSTNSNSRRGSSDFGGSDANSATSSNPHLPLPIGGIGFRNVSAPPRSSRSYTPMSS